MTLILYAKMVLAWTVMMRDPPRQLLSITEDGNCATPEIGEHGNLTCSVSGLTFSVFVTTLPPCEPSGGCSDGGQHLREYTTVWFYSVPLQQRAPPVHVCASPFSNPMY